MFRITTVEWSSLFVNNAGLLVFMMKGKVKLSTSACIQLKNLLLNFLEMVTEKWLLIEMHIDGA